MTSTVRKIVSSAKLPKNTYPYSQGVLVDKTLYIAGQIGWDCNAKVTEGVGAQTKLALENMGHVLAAVGATHKNVVKVTVLLKDINDFDEMNEVYATFFTQNYPARAAYAVADLPVGALIEIEAVAILGDIVDCKL
ncbi:2-iminobutanoate/2-iminopropanoate deaminase [Folsomia candida]|uniref:2-iminobutanoate/2-iminopropanoate deaminase n=1 Tax=Folsomia candida TaxID=158441 RepID=UPI000B8F9E2A|nr:2-iminobutanoate/2-iminopropanoate deaminase [Folsomia candida]